LPVAFAGTAVEVGVTSVTIDVDRWYAGGAADQVTVGVPGQADIGEPYGVQFVEGSAIC